MRQLYLDVKELLFSLELQEWFVIVAVSIMIFGISKLRQIANALGDSVDSIKDKF